MNRFKEIQIEQNYIIQLSNKNSEIAELLKVKTLLKETISEDKVLIKSLKEDNKSLKEEIASMERLSKMIQEIVVNIKDEKIKNEILGKIDVCHQNLNSLKLNNWK